MEATADIEEGVLAGDELCQRWQVEQLLRWPISI